MRISAVIPQAEREITIILLEQVRTIDKQRLRQYLGMIPDDIVARVDKALAISVALEKMKATDV